MIFLGKIVKIRSNKGEVVYKPFLEIDVGELTLKEGDKVLLKSERHQKELRIEDLKEINGAYVLKFFDIDTINEALKLIGYSIFCFKNSDDEEIDKGICGFLVKDTNDQVWGYVKGIDSKSDLNKLLVIQEGDDEFYVPYNDEILKEINKKGKYIIIDPPSGLKELNK